MRNFLVLLNANFFALGLYAFITGSIISAFWMIVCGLSIRSIYKHEDKSAYHISMLLNFGFLSMGGAYSVVQFFKNPEQISSLMMIVLTTGFIVLPILNIWYIFKKSQELPEAEI